MKTIILITVLLFISNMNAISQTYEPSQKTVHKCGVPYTIDSQSDDFKQKVPILGWMWGSKALISKALYATQNDITSGDKFKYICKDLNLLVKSSTYGWMYANHGNGTNMLMARAMVFNPALEIPDPITDYNAIANQCDSSNHSSVFGFKYIHAQAYKTDSGLVLQKVRFPGITKVLDLPWDIDK